MTAPGRARLLSPAMLGVASGAILVPLNSTMLAVALPSIMDEFGIDADDRLVAGHALPRRGDGRAAGQRQPRRPVRPTARSSSSAWSAFALSSLLAAVAPSFELLALARVLQAVSGALVSTTSVALVRALSPADRRGAAFGLFDMLVSTSAAIGPFIGGVLVGAFGWRSLFVIAVPVALFAALMVGLVVRPDRGGGRCARRGGRRRPRPATRPIDIPGLVLLAAVLIALLVAIRGRAAMAGSASLAAVAVIPLAFLFVRFELATDHPAVDPRLFTIRPFAAAVLGVLGATVILHAAFILVPLLVEELLPADRADGRSGPARRSRRLGAIAAPIGGRLSDRYGRRLPGRRGLALRDRRARRPVAGSRPTAPRRSSALLLGVVGLGLGLSGSPRQAAAMEAVTADRVGMAAGTYYTGRYLGGVIGASLAGAVLGATVTGAGVTLGFGLLALVGVAIVAVSFGLPDRPLRRATAAARRQGHEIVAVRSVVPKPSSAFRSRSRQLPAVTGIAGVGIGRRFRALGTLVRAHLPAVLVEQVDLVHQGVAAPLRHEPDLPGGTSVEPRVDAVRFGGGGAVEPGVLDLDRRGDGLERDRQVDPRGVRGAAPKRDRPVGMRLAGLPGEHAG